MLSADLLIQLGAQVPGMIIMAWVVWKFLGELKNSREAKDKQTEMMVEALNHNSEMMGKCSSALERAERTLADAQRK
ncbi:MAG: hypothetical protein ACKVH8_14160 [Pirellulales bacterium]